MTDLWIVGSGGHAAVVAEIADLLGLNIIGFVDDDAAKIGATVLRWRVLGTRQSVPQGSPVALAVGDNAARLNLLKYAESQGHDLPVLAHPSAVISPSAELGPGTVVMAQVAVNARTVVGRACILNTACSIDHDCRIEDGSHIAPGSRLAGQVAVGTGTFIGVGSSVIPSIVIGSHSTIGAGSVVVDDVPDGSVAYGNPARVRSSRSTRSDGTYC
jgi:sugar O-acyltransferase (sialic acid O-acetyltransferase NeuD family)